MKPILHSVSYAGAWVGQAHLTLDEFVDKAAELGFAGLMLMAKRPHLSVLDYDADTCARLRERIDSRGLTCDAIAAYTNFSADAEHGEVPQREFQIQHVTELARLARDLGASVVRVFTAYEHPVLAYPRLGQLVAETLRECARRTADFGVTIGVQNHHDFACDDRTLTDLLAAVGELNCKASYDAWSPALHGADIVAAATRMAPLICHTTAADYQLRPRFHYQPEFINYTAATPWSQMVPMGEGFIDYKGFFDALRAGGYDGTVAFEMCAPLLGGGFVENLDRHARRFLEFIEPWR